MADIDINDVGVPGVVQDTPAYQMEPEAWTTALNMRCRDGGMVSIPGWASIFGTPSVAPHFAMPVVSISQVFWLYMSLTKAYVWDGSSHSNITRQTASADVDYTTGNGRDINGTLFAGIPILNTGSDDPQYWSDYVTTTKLQALPNWPANSTIKCLRSFGAYLVGINYYNGTNNYPHLVKWSSSASGAGTLPQSWDETDATLDTGEYDLPDVNSGILQEAMQLGAKLMLYKEQSMWSMRYIGGRPIFAFDTFSDVVGILAPRCVTPTGDGKKHVMATQDDIVIHDGNSPPTSLLNKRMRRSLFQNIDTQNYKNSFMFTDYINTEIYFCYPEQGQEFATRALIFNYRTGALTEMDGVTFRNATVGQVEDEDTETWDTGTDTWEEDTGPWSSQERRQLVLCDPTNTKLHKTSTSTYTRDGVSYSSTLQRTGLALIGKKRNGEWIVNHEIMKFVDRMWPKVQGGPVQIRVGSQMTVDGTVTWGPYQTFSPGTDVAVDIAVSARAVAVEFRMQTTGDWRLDGYRLSITPDGHY